MICPTCRVISNMLALKSNHKYVVIFIFIYELLSIGGLGKSKTKRAESPMLSIAQGNALGKRIQTINAPCKGNCKK